MNIRLLTAFFFVFEAFGTEINKDNIIEDPAVHQVAAPSTPIRFPGPPRIRDERCVSFRLRLGFSLIKDGSVVFPEIRAQLLRYFYFAIYRAN